MKNDAPNIHTWNTSFQDFILNGKVTDESRTLIQHITCMNTTTLKEMMLLLGSISNYHWWQYTRCDGENSSRNIHVNLHDHMLYHPSCDENDENLRTTYFPKSPRNRLMYYIYTNTLYQHSIGPTINQLVKIDDKEENAISYSEMNEDETEHTKKRGSI